MKKLFKFSCYLGSMGELDGLFIASQSQVDEIIGKEIYFGEVLGKHSDISVEIEKNDIEEISDDQDLIIQLFRLFESTTLCGHNPISYYEIFDD